MMTQTTISTPTRQTVQDEIGLLVQELPYDSLLILREFGRFLRFQRQQQLATSVPVAANDTQAPLFHTRQAHYPIVRVTPAQLLDLIGALPPIGGDALADTEAIYEKD